MQHQLREHRSCVRCSCTGSLTAADLTAFYFYSQTVQDAMQSLSDNILSILTGLGVRRTCYHHPAS
jgi:hypothetical protein